MRRRRTRNVQRWRLLYLRDINAQGQAVVHMKTHVKPMNISAICVTGFVKCEWMKAFRPRVMGKHLLGFECDSQGAVCNNSIHHYAIKHVQGIHYFHHVYFSRVSCVLVLLVFELGGIET